MKQLWILSLGALAAAASSGCFSERAIPFNPRSSSPVDIVATEDTRAWLRAAHAKLAPRLPRSGQPALLTEQLEDDRGRPVDVLAHFGENPQTLTSIFGNMSGLTHTAQATGAEDRGAKLPHWPGFEDIWLPTGGDCEYAARVGWARKDGQVCQADCVIVLPGLFGDNWVQRTRDVAAALRESGIHAVALELRGFGRTRLRYPDLSYGYSVLETSDLLHVAAWLQQQPHVRRTGLVGFCWSAHQALIAAWEAGRAADDPDVSPRLRTLLRARPPGPLLTAGVLAFSPVLRFEQVIERCEHDWSLFDDPVIASLQDTIHSRMLVLGAPHPSGKLREAIQEEFRRGPLSYATAYEECLNYLRLLPHGAMPVGKKLESAPIRALIVQGADDPLTSAQYVADLVSGVDNRRVAAIVLPGGGHVGFAPYARDYFYGLLLSYFRQSQ